MAGYVVVRDRGVGLCFFSKVALSCLGRKWEGASLGLVAVLVSGWALLAPTSGILLGVGWVAPRHSSNFC